MRIGVVGLGKMGEPIARRLLDAGHEVTVFNRTPGRADGLVERGATRAASPAEIWESADSCITMVADDDALRAVMVGDGGLLGAGPPGRVVVDMSTVSVEASAGDRRGGRKRRRRLPARPGEREPVRRRSRQPDDHGLRRQAGVRAARAGPARRRPERLLSRPRRGGPGAEARAQPDDRRDDRADRGGARARRGERAGPGGDARGDRGRARSARRSSSTSPAPLVANDYTATFTVDMMHKDLVLAGKAADAVGVPLPVTSSVRGPRCGVHRDRARRPRPDGAAPQARPCRRPADGPRHVTPFTVADHSVDALGCARPHRLRTRSDTCRRRSSTPFSRPRWSGRIRDRTGTRSSCSAATSGRVQGGPARGGLPRRDAGRAPRPGGGRPRHRHRRPDVVRRLRRRDRLVLLVHVRADRRLRACPRGAPVGDERDRRDTTSSSSSPTGAA